MRALRILPWVFKPPVIDCRRHDRKIDEWSNIARKQGLLGLEPAIEGETDEFIARRPAAPGRRRRAGVHPRDPRGGDGGARRAPTTAAAKVFEGMGIYAPTLGIIGAVLGLMAVMQNLADPSKLGARHRGCLHRDGLRHRPRQPVPPADGGQAQGDRQGAERTCARWCIEGMIAIAQGENPRNIESRLQGYLQ